jgi:alpha-galactosidase
VDCQIVLDGKLAADSGVIQGNEAPKQISVSLVGAKKIEFIVKKGSQSIDFAHADWGNAYFTLADDQTSLPDQPPYSDYLSAAGRLREISESAKPVIHGAQATGATPGRPFLFRIPTTGERPIEFSVKNLPAGLTLDKQKGIISGSLRKDGSTRVTLIAKNSLGTATRTLVIIGGVHKLAQTPPMGWNSWNVWAGNVDQDKMKATVDAMIASGLADYGYQYVNIDDTWEADRNAAGEIQTNDKFPNIKDFTDYAHSFGLKAGIYSSPGPKTCANFTASYQHEQQDANSYAKWGFDYLKHDWCSYGSIAKDDSLPELQKPYFTMEKALDNVDRDIVYSLCQYGMGDVWKWGADVNGNCWRTTGDINDSWGSLHSIYESQNGHEAYAKPGRWNDPDMLIVGQVGWGNPHPTHLKANEQILHISMWCLLSAPLIIGCDMTKLDSFTKALLTNDEAIDIDQDPLGKAAKLVATNVDGGEVWARSLSDGSQAVGLVNPFAWPLSVRVSWKDLGLTGKHAVRDLWLHENEGASADYYETEVPAHGCVLLKIGK